MEAFTHIGVTERGDPAIDQQWLPWVVEGKPAILISKNPGRLYVLLHCHTKDPNVIIHCTITGYGSTVLEPNVPKPSDALDGYKRMVEKFGSDRVVLRVDPVIPTLKGRDLAKRIIDAGMSIANTRVRISFLDMYPHVKERFLSKKIPLLDYDFHAPLALREEVWDELGRPEVCGEPGFKCTGCISEKDCEILGVYHGTRHWKQRPTCNCAGNKFELLNNKKQCGHFCLYCYWKG